MDRIASLQTELTERILKGCKENPHHRQDPNCVQIDSFTEMLDVDVSEDQDNSSVHFNPLLRAVIVEVDLDDV